MSRKRKRTRTKVSKSDVALRERKLSGKMRRKLVWVFGTIILALVGLSVRITVINATSGEKYKKEVLTQSQQQYESRVIPFKRGDILDANGTVLATSEKVYNIILDCKVVNSNKKYIEPTIAALVSVLGMNEAEIRDKLENEKTKSSQYQIIESEVPITDKKDFEDYCDVTGKELSDEEISSRQNVKGVWFEEDYVRSYPMKSAGCDVIGFTYSGNVADWGIEGYYSSTLNGVNGRQYGYFNSDADVEQTIIEPQSGNSVVSTIDINIQEIAEKYIAQFMEELSGGPHGSKGAQNIGVIVADPNTGDILAMAGSDPYDLNNPRDLTPYYSDEEIAAMSDDDMLDNLNALWKNYCISDAFEPGSTVKPMSVAAALESGHIHSGDTFYCDGYQMVSGEQIKCSVFPGSHETQTLSEVMGNSCNDALMQMAEKMGIDDFVRYQEIFNLGSRTGIDLPGEASGITRDANSMGTVDLATASFGQGYTITMIQEMMAFCSTINGGYYYQPHVVKKVIDSDGAILKNVEPTVLKQTISEDVSNQVREQTAAVVEKGGTGRFAKIDGYSMGGKTGTAQKIPRGNGKYLVSHIGFAPLNNPKVAVYVVVDEPNVENQSISTYAQHLFRQIMADILPYMNIFPDEELTGAGTGLTMDEILASYGENFRVGTSAEVSYDDDDEEESTGSDDVNQEQTGSIDDAATEGISDTSVPEPDDAGEEVTGGNTAQDEGITNQEAGIESDD